MVRKIGEIVQSQDYQRYFSYGSPSFEVSRRHSQIIGSSHRIMRVVSSHISKRLSTFTTPKEPCYWKHEHIDEELGPHECKTCPRNLICGHPEVNGLLLLFSVGAFLVMKNGGNIQHPANPLSKIIAADLSAQNIYGTSNDYFMGGDFEQSEENSIQKISHAQELDLKTLHHKTQKAVEHYKLSLQESLNSLPYMI